MILVPLIDWKFLNAFAAGGAGTSNRRHQCPGSEIRLIFVASHSSKFSDAPPPESRQGSSDVAKVRGTSARRSDTAMGHLVSQMPVAVHRLISVRRSGQLSSS